MTIAVFAIALVVAALIVVSLCVPLGETLRLPLAVVLALVGVTLGSLPLLVESSLQVPHLDSYDAWFVSTLALDTEAIILLFLPPLLFEMALSVNVRRLSDDLALVAVMAVIAVITATVFVGASLAWFPQLGAMTAFLLGAVISTTDPGAVVTTFREIGAPRRLLVILEGESLLNDAAAIALFGLLIGIAQTPGELPLWNAALSFLFVFAAGAGLGIAAAILFSRAYRLLGGSSEAEASLTLALAYGSFLFAEQVVGASGVVAVVFASLTTSVVGPERMGPGNWLRVQTLWGHIGFWANAFILLLAAVLVPRLLLDLGWSEIGLLAIVVVSTFAARALVLFGLLPVLSRLGLTARILRPQKIMIWWGGVRGAVTIVLALGLSEVTALPEEQRRLAAALACGFVFWTLLVNASSLRLLSRRLGLDRLSTSDRALRERVVAATVGEVARYVRELASERASRASTHAAVEAAYEQLVEHESEDIEVPLGDRLTLGLSIVANQESRLVRRQFEEGALEPEDARILRTHAERLADAARTGGLAAYEETMEELLDFPRGFEIALFLQHRTGVGFFLRRLLARRFALLLESEGLLRELLSFTAERLPAMIGEDASGRIVELLKRRLDATESTLQAIETQYPSYARRLRRLLLLRAGARREGERYERLHRDGITGPELHRSLMSELAQRRRRLMRLPPLDLGLNRAQLLRNVPLFKNLTEEERRLIGRRMRPRLIAPGQTVLEVGDASEEMSFIASGVLEVEAGGRSKRIGTGAFFGEPARKSLASTGAARTKHVRVTAVGFCRLLVLTHRDFDRLMRRHPALAEHIRSAVGRAA